MARGQLADEVVEAFIASGLPWALVPREWGGSGVTDVVAMIDILDEIAYADGSAGWVMMAATFGAANVSALLEPEAAEAMVGAERRGIMVGAAAPSGRAVKVDGGFSVSGRWQFGSGANMATTMAAGCHVFDADGEQELIAGEPRWILALVPKDQVEMLGNWDVSGLQATASWDYEVHDAFVPASNVIELPTPVIRRTDSIVSIGFLAGVYAQHVSVALGIVRRAFAEIAKIASTKTRGGYDGPIGRSPVFLYEFAQKEAEYQAMRTYIRDSFAGAQRRAGPDGPTPADFGRLQAACSWMTQLSLDLVRWCDSWAGSSAVRLPSALSRCLNDIAVMANHLYVDRMNVVNGAGAILDSWIEE